MKTQTTPPAASSTSFPVLSAEALACLTQDELHDLLAPSLPDSPEMRITFIKLTNPVFPPDRQVSAPPGKQKKEKKSQKAVSKRKSTPGLNQIDIELDDLRKSRAVLNLEGVQQIFRSLPIKPGKPTQPQMELLCRILGERKLVAAECARLELPNPYEVDTEYFGLVFTGVVSALAPPPRRGRRRKEVTARMSQLREELHSRKRHRSQVGGKCEPLWRQQSPDTSPPPPDPPTLPFF